MEKEASQIALLSQFDLFALPEDMQSEARNPPCLFPAQPLTLIREFEFSPKRTPPIF